MIIGGLCPLLQVFDMPTSLRFYCNVLGFTATSPVPDDGRCEWVLLQLNGSKLMLNTAYERDERPDNPDPERKAAHKDIAPFFDCTDVEGACRDLVEKGLAVKQPLVRDYGMKQLYLWDPDGYEICLQHPVE